MWIVALWNVKKSMIFFYCTAVAVPLCRRIDSPRGSPQTQALRSYRVFRLYCRDTASVVMRISSLNEVNWAIPLVWNAISTCLGFISNSLDGPGRQAFEN